MEALCYWIDELRLCLESLNLAIGTAQYVCARRGDTFVIVAHGLGGPLATPPG